MLPLLPFTPAHAFYNAAVESSRLIKNLKTDFGATGQGVEDDSARLQAAIDEVSRGGGGGVRIPAGEYFLTNVSMKSNVHLDIDPNVVLKPYLKNATRNVSLFNLGIDKRMNDAQIGGMDNIVGRNISCTDGNAAVMISPHSMNNGVVTVDGVKSVGCGFGVRIANGFIATKYATPNLQPGSFAAGSSVKNVDATFGLKAQLKSKHFKYVPAPLRKLIQDEKESEDGASVRGPAIAAVLNEASYPVTVENVTSHGFKDMPDIMTESNAAGTERRQKAGR